MRPIDKLRKWYGGKWTYDPDEHVWIQWTENGPKCVYRYSILVPRYDGDDDSFMLEYRWYDTGKVLCGMSTLHMACKRLSTGN